MRKQADQSRLWDGLLGHWLRLFSNVNVVKDQNKKKVDKCSKLNETKETCQLGDGVLNPKLKERRVERKEGEEGSIYKGHLGAKWRNLSIVFIR